MSIRPPKKFLDKDRTEINPAWKDWHTERLHWRIATLGPGEHERYFPEEHGKAIPEEGCWIRVLEEPHTELRSRFRVPVQSMWRARPHTLNSGGFGGVRAKQAVIATPGGDLHLWPHEYDVVPDISLYVGQEPDVTMHTLGGEPVFSREREDQLFYLMSRGITQHDAALLLLNELDSQDFCYFTLSDEMVEMFGGIGVPLWRHIQLHPRESQKPFAVELEMA